MNNMKNNQSGFTLIELMIATAMVTIVVGVIYAAYNIQTKIYTEQDKTAEMQQNLRAGMWYLQREIRVAGYNSQNTGDPSCGGSGKPGIHTATATTLGFSMDLDKNGKCDGSGENVTYSIVASDKELVRAAPAQANPIAQNITKIDFLYLLEDSDGNKSQTRTPGVSPSGPIEDIVAVQVSMLAQSKTEDRGAITTTTFTLPIPNPEWGVSTDPITWKEENSRYRYRLLSTTINLRNMRLL